MLEFLFEQSYSGCYVKSKPKKRGVEILCGYSSCPGVKWWLTPGVPISRVALNLELLILTDGLGTR